MIKSRNIKVVQPKDRKNYMIFDLEGLTIGKVYTKEGSGKGGW